jgi:hypothetical protein
MSQVNNIPYKMALKMVEWFNALHGEGSYLAPEDHEAFLMLKKRIEERSYDENEIVIVHECEWRVLFQDGAYYYCELVANPANKDYFYPEDIERKEVAV